MSVQVAAQAASSGGTQVPAVRALLPADTLRPCRIEDLPAVAALFRSVFHGGDRLPTDALAAYLREIYFEHPWYDPQTPSHVFVSSDGAIDGFIGALPLRLRFHGRPVRAAIAGALMVRDPAHRPMAGARLIRSFMSGPQALSLGDTANWTSKTLWEKLGGRTLPLASMEWLKIVRPVPFGISVVRNRLPRPLGLALAPFAALASLRLRRAPAAPAAPSRTVDDDAYLAAFRDLSAAREVTIDLDDAAGHWMLAQAARKTRHGDLFRRTVTGRGGKLAGCYLVYIRSGAAAEVLQVTVAPGQGETVFTDLIAFAAASGCLAVRGRSQNDLMDALFKTNCILRHRGASVAATRDGDLMQALEAGSAPLGGFFGETWIRLVSDDFA
jgi:hypothetical protein